MSKQTRYRIVASALLLAALVAVAWSEIAAIPVFSWVGSGDYAAGLARFLAGGFSTLLVVFLLFPLLGQREHALANRKLEGMLRLEPPLDDWAIGVIREQERHLRWLAWRLSGRNLLLSVFGGLIAAAVADWWGGSALTVACLLGLGWGGVVGLATGLWDARHPLPPEEDLASVPGVPPLSDLDGSLPEHRQRLRELGFVTADDLLQAAAAPEARRRLADQLGVSAPLVEQFAIETELLRSIAGLNEEYAGLLYRADVAGVADLAGRDPVRLASLLRERYSQVVERGEDPPTDAMVGNWVAQARRAKPLLKF